MFQEEGQTKRRGSQVLSLRILHALLSSLSEFEFHHHIRNSFENNLRRLNNGNIYPAIIHLKSQFRFFLQAEEGFCLLSMNGYLNQVPIQRG